MKKLLVVLMLFAMVGVSWGAGASTSCDNGTELKSTAIGVDDSYKPHTWLYTCTFTADNGTGAFTNGTVTLQGYILKVTTDPGSTAPTDNYDIVINGPYGADVMGGALANRNTSNTETAYALAQDGTSVIYPYAYGSHTVVVTNNSVNSATFVMYVYVQR